ncbi:MAG: hypothetical protein NXY57DRAFT_531336 [Lentinula lateritia]|uniref:NAD-dependent epimerase/dehydratase domain-containing protein n=1 Tax=Lentinula lateritia TaxID=40482 RepID=A0ABQ8VJ42_9AGAR|nr:MAG: hypothetical protein NXY57DRAFT_531336 [Lentinula lateritia]KAJ4495646.1 hypothetical protein C8R41DRAFT_762403 [Lentinula lateritia]
MSAYIQNKLAKGEKLQFFITGATGYIGLVLTEFAIAQGFSVRGLSRSEAGDEKLKSLGATPVRGDITTHEVLARESTAADAIIHLAWNHDWTGDYNKIVDTDIAAVEAICAQIKDTGKPLVIASGCAGAQPNADGSDSDENAPLRPNLPVARRLESEINAIKKQGIHGCSIRLSPYVYGRGGKGFLVMLMGQAVKLNESLYINDGSFHTSVLHVEDAARLFIAAVLKSKTGEAYNGVGQTDVSLKDMAEAIGKVVGVPVRSATFEEATEKWSPPILPIFNYLDVRGSNKKAKELLGWKPEGVDFITDIVSGSYVPVAAYLKAQ